MRKRHRLGVVAAAAMGIVTFFGSSAMAHDAGLTVWGGLIARGRGFISQNHTYVKACDYVADGFGVRTWYYNPSKGWFYVADPDGKGGVCGERGVGYTVTLWQVCFGPLGDETCTSIQNP